jgi:hypothetical protein
MRIRLLSAMSFAVLLASSPVASQQVPANDSAKVVTVKKLFALTRTKEFHTQTLDFMWERYAQVPNLAPYAEVMRDFLAKHVNFEAIEGDLIALYREYYTETELQQLIRFYESPLGQRVADVTPALSFRMGQLTSERINRLLPELMRQLTGGKAPQFIEPSPQSDEWGSASA